MSYVDGFVAAVPKANREAYLAFAELALPIFLEHGAVSATECWGDDVPKGEVTSFPKAVDLKDDETVVFSWIVWPDKATRERGMEAVMADPRLADKDMPFDGKRMIYGGFTTLLTVGPGA
ncbi:MAG: DUF1428 domain-containing protein [Pseudomonadota bacterium]